MPTRLIRHPATADRHGSGLKVNDSLYPKRLRATGAQALRYIQEDQGAEQLSSRQKASSPHFGLTPLSAYAEPWLLPERFPISRLPVLQFDVLRGQDFGGRGSRSQN